MNPSPGISSKTSTDQVVSYLPSDLLDKEERPHLELTQEFQSLDSTYRDIVIPSHLDTRHNRSSSTKSMVPPPHEMDLKFFASGQRMEHGQCSGQGDITN
jgi:hypothetical protein